MKLVSGTFIAASLFLVACGSGGGGSNGGSNPPPPPPPVVTVNQYESTVDEHQGRWGSESTGWVEYTPSTDSLVIDTVRYGTVSVGPSRRFTIGGIEHAVNFSESQLKLVIGELTSPTHFASWDLVLLSSAN
jgi:hypothetical protein